MDVDGSLEYGLTWKETDMPWGPPICQLQASGRRTSVNAYGGWPTPRAADADKGVRSPEGAGDEYLRRPTGHDLNTAAVIAGWPTPKAGDRKGGYPTEEAAWKRHVDEQKRNLVDAAVLAGWPSPNVPNGGRSIRHAEMRGGTFYHNGKKVQVDLGGLARLVTPPEDSGTEPTSSTAETERFGALNPEFVRWLMGYEPEHTSCAPSVTPSSPNWPPNSSEHQPEP